MPTDLKAFLRQRIIDDVIGSSKERDTEAMVMVADAPTISMISSCCQMHEINEAGVGVIQNIKYQREKMPFPAVYFLEPSAASVQGLTDDFKDANNPAFSRVHLFFNDTCPPDLMRKIGAAPNIRKYLKSLKEVFFDFQALESRVFTLNRRNTIPVLYDPSYDDVAREEEIQRTVQQIVALCITLREFPYIRYHTSSDTKLKLNERIAREVEKRLSNKARTLIDWKIRQQRSTLILADRSFDPVVPLMHEYTYQAMASDLCNFTDGAVILDEVKNDDNGRVRLKEDDPLWVELRHQHIGNVSNRVSKIMDKLRSSGARALQGKDRSAVSMKEIQSAIKEMPQYQKTLKSMGTHVNLASKCMQLYKSDKLHDISQLEQDMATGLDEDQKKTKLKVIEERLSSMIQDPQINTQDKLRLVMIYIITQDGINEATRKTLFRVADFDMNQQIAVKNLFNLGVSLQQSCSKNRGKTYSQNELERNAERAASVPLELMRYLPRLTSVIEEHFAGNLGRETYPYVTEPPPEEAPRKKSRADRSRRKRRAGRGGKDDAENEDDGEPRLIVFMVGGMTYSEIRVAYDACKNTSHDVIIGSSSILNASEYISNLSTSPEDSY